MAKIKLTPEQIKAQNEAREVAAAKRQAEIAQAKRDRIAANAAQHEKLRTMATLMDCMSGTSAADQISQDIAWRWLLADKEVREWQADFLANPADRFEWSEQAMKYACERELLDTILYALMKGDKTVEQTVLEIADEVTDRYLNNYDCPSSTSSAHNALMIIKQDVRSYYIRKGGAFVYWRRLAQESQTTVSTTTSPVS